MSRIVVAEQELLGVLNSKLQRQDGCVGCRFTSLQRVVGAAPGECNWAAANLRCSGTPSSVCQPAARAVVAEVSQTHNLSG